jgi:hypothetical protein
MRSVVVVFVAGAAVLAAVVAVTLTRAPPRVVLIGAPGVKAAGPYGVRTLTVIAGDANICQGGEVLPRGVSAVRVSLWAFFGARVRVEAFAGSRLLTVGTRGADWTTDSVTVPVRPLARTVTGVTLCTVIGPNRQPLLVLGSRADRNQATLSTSSSGTGSRTGVGGRLAIEYLAAGQSSWWSRILPVARHLGLGRPFSGTWIALLVAALMAAVAVLTVRLTLRELS